MNGHRSDDWEWQQFLGHIAGQVDELILKCDNLSIFREMIRPLVVPWQRYYELQQKEYNNLKETWEKVKANPKYQDKESGPPEKEYEWDDYYLLNVSTTNSIRIEGLDLDDGPTYEMPMKYAKQYIKALETFVKRNTKRLEECQPESIEGKRLQESMSKQKRTIRIAKSQVRRIIAKNIKTAWIRVPALWWRYLDMEDKEIYGCWRPKTSEMAEHPIMEKFKPPTMGSDGLPKPKNIKEEYERYYCILTSIHDNKLPGCHSISEGVWPEELANQLWGRFSWARPYGPSKHFINAALNRVKADLKKPRGKSGRDKKEITKKITEDELSERIQPDKASAGKTDKAHYGQRRFIPRSVYRGLESQEVYDRRRAAEQEARTAEQHAKNERYRTSREKAIQYLADARIREYWSRQAESAFIEDALEWRTRPLAWPKDKPIIYAIMLLVANYMSKVCILPQALIETAMYKKNEKVWWVCRYDYAGQFVAFIEADLKEQGLLKSERQGHQRRKQGRPRLSEKDREEAKRRDEFLEKWEKEKGTISVRQFCQRENVPYQSSRKNYLKTCKDWERQKRTN
jgi:hypothetical protein